MLPRPYGRTEGLLDLCRERFRTYAFVSEVTILFLKTSQVASCLCAGLVSAADYKGRHFRYERSLPSARPTGHGGDDFNYLISFTYDTNNITTGTPLPTTVATQVVPIDSMTATVYRRQESYSINVLTDDANAKAVLALGSNGGMVVDQLNHTDWHCQPLGSNNCAGLRYAGRPRDGRFPQDNPDLAEPFYGALQVAVVDWPRHPGRTLYGEAGDFIYLNGFDYNGHTDGTAQFSVVCDPVATPEPASMAICGSGLLAVALMFRKRRNSNQK